MLEECVRPIREWLEGSGATGVNGVLKTLKTYSGHRPPNVEDFGDESSLTLDAWEGYGRKAPGLFVGLRGAIPFSTTTDGYLRNGTVPAYLRWKSKDRDVEQAWRAGGVTLRAALISLRSYFDAAESLSALRNPNGLQHVALVGASLGTWEAGNQEAVSIMDLDLSFQVRETA